MDLAPVPERSTPLPGAQPLVTSGAAEGGSIARSRPPLERDPALGSDAISHTRSSSWSLDQRRGSGRPSIASSKALPSTTRTTRRLARVIAV
jgi:hypothetical protein